MNMKPTTPIRPTVGLHGPDPALAVPQDEPKDAPTVEPQDVPLQWVSVLADGEVRARVDELHLAIHSASADSDAIARWRDYHLIGEALRSPRSVALASSPDDAFLARLRAGMAAEAQAHQTAMRGAVVGGAAAVATVATQAQPAANDAVFRWKLVAGFASVAAIGALAWSFLGTALPSGPQLATAPAPTQPATVLASNAPAAAATSAAPSATPAVVATATAAGAMLRDPQLDAFLQAHREAGGPSALHMPAGFLRNATFEGPAR